MKPVEVLRKTVKKMNQFHCKKSFNPRFPLSWPPCGVSAAKCRRLPIAPECGLLSCLCGTIFTQFQQSLGSAPPAWSESTPFQAPDGSDFSVVWKKKISFLRILEFPRSNV